MFYTYLQTDTTDESWLGTSGVPFTVAADPCNWSPSTGTRSCGAPSSGTPTLPTPSTWPPAWPGWSAGWSERGAGQHSSPRAYHLPVIKDFSGQFSDKFGAYDWALSTLWPRLTHRMLTAIEPTQT